MQIQVNFFKDTKGRKRGVILESSRPLTPQPFKWFHFLCIVCCCSFSSPWTINFLIRAQINPRVGNCKTPYQPPFLRSCPPNTSSILMNKKCGRNIRCKSDWQSSTLYFHWLPGMKVKSMVSRWDSLSSGPCTHLSPDFLLYCPMHLLIQLKWMTRCYPRGQERSCLGNLTHVEPSAQHPRPLSLAKFFFFKKGLKCHLFWEVLCDSLS